jgi:hypothetical protein
MIALSTPSKCHNKAIKGVFDQIGMTADNLNKLFKKTNKEY